LSFDGDVEEKHMAEMASYGEVESDRTGDVTRLRNLESPEKGVESTNGSDGPAVPNLGALLRCCDTVNVLR
jgi:hypothetical protein